MWKILYDSVAGTSHRESNLECQDSCFVTPFARDGEAFLIAVCSDGAGSATESKVGSSLACETITRAVIAFLERGDRLADIDSDTIHIWFQVVHEALENCAMEKGFPARELACTLLFSLLGEERAIFAQIGDGAMVISENDKFRPIFWPQNGEYQNTTFFITDSNFSKNVQIKLLEQSVEEFAAFTDGLQMLALKYADQTAHSPFFQPMFGNLREVDDPGSLQIALREFLDSAPVNSRTDDDKTLVLATRQKNCAEAV